MEVRPFRIRLREQDVVYFLHIPRTGGTSFWELLASRFPPGLSRKGGGRRVLRRELLGMPPEELSRYRLFSGHYDTSVTGLLGRVPHFVTLLREPIARMVSLYEIVKRMPSHHLHREIVSGMTFREFLDHPRGGRADRDRQVRQLAGAMDGTPRGRTGPLAGRELLELACERLEEIAFFGLRERYADSVRLLAHTFHWEPFRRIPHLNATGTRNDRSRLDPEELESARELNRLDLELYRFAGDLFRGRLDTLPVARATPPPDGTGVPAS